jgi:hypothetical protein
MGVMASFGFSIITLTYLVSFIFKNSVYAFNKIGVWYVIFGLVLPMVLTMVIAASMSNRESESFLMAWQYVVCADPFVGLAGGL